MRGPKACPEPEKQTLGKTLWTLRTPESPKVPIGSDGREKLLFLLIRFFILMPVREKLVKNTSEYIFLQ